MDNKHTSQSESAWQSEQPNRKPNNMELCRRTCWATPGTGGQVWGADTGASAAVNGWILAFIPASGKYSFPQQVTVTCCALEDAIAPFLRKRLVY